MNTAGWLRDLGLEQRRCAKHRAWLVKLLTWQCGCKRECRRAAGVTAAEFCSRYTLRERRRLTIWCP